MGDLLPVVLEVGEVNLKCMELLDRANTETFGNPEPTKVRSGEDRLKSYHDLFTTAWQSQQSEFHNIPAPILFTTNCLMPVRQSYSDRVFTTSIVSYPEMVHIGEDKDFTPVIEKALDCKGYDREKPLKGINGGSTVTTGFGHGAVLENAGKIVDLVKKEKFDTFSRSEDVTEPHTGQKLLYGICQKTPMDTIILTLACGKYRLNDLDLGEIEGLPRILDMGQCNDAYSAITVALALAEAFECDLAQGQQEGQLAKRQIIAQGDRLQTAVQKLAAPVELR